MKNELIKAEFKNKGLTCLPDTKTWMNRFEIKSESSNRLYTIAQRTNGTEWGCSCMGWIRYRKCKHLTSIMPLIESTVNKVKLLNNG